MKQTIQQYLEVPANWPIKENIKHEILIMPNANDIKTANKKNPKSCALANAACRLFNVPHAAIGGRWAYIPQRDSNGKHYIARMQTSSATERAIRKFDETGEMPENGFKFIPIRPSHTYKRKRAYQKLWNAGKVGHNGKRKRMFPRRIKTRTIPVTTRKSA